MLPLFLLTAGLALAQQSASWEQRKATEIRMENRVAACVTLTPTAISRDGMIVKLSAAAVFAKSTGECGCKSARLYYQVNTEVAGMISTMGGAAAKHRMYEFVLSTDASITPPPNIALTIGCNKP